jgi:hypothetical protein
MTDWQIQPIETFTTDELATELHRRHNAMLLVIEKDPSPDDRSTMSIYGPDETSAGYSRSLGLCEAAKQQLLFDFLLVSRTGRNPD